ncbi:MAG TPA: cyclase family protein [Phycisphaerae bacterium]|nr:cyclase family protein [Phycisphaerae bacterium]
MIYDISPPVTARLAVWPGDVPFSRQILTDLRAGDGTTSSALHGTAHLGAHADALGHVDRRGAPIDAMPLDRYLGPCQVVRVSVGRGAAVAPGAITEPIKAPRVLIATGTYPDPERFNEDFAALSVELIDDLHARGAVLVGVDTPSVDLYAAADLPVHKRLAGYGMASLEGLVLGEVPAGIYELIALPLRLVGCDASPVRAVLRELPPSGLA